MLALTLLSFVMAEGPAVKGYVQKSEPPAVKGFVAPKATAASGVAARTFRNGANYGYHAGHNCPNCGREQLRPSSGTKWGPHWHTCANCLSTWRH